jgi:hypothetical protein
MKRRWAGVPFRLRAGKALGGLNKKAVITFQQPAWVPEGLLGYERPDRVHIGFDPDVFQLDFNVTDPDNPRAVNPVAMKASFGPVDCLPTERCSRGCWMVTRPCQCVATRPSRRGGSSSRCFAPGAPMPFPWRSIRPVAVDR